MTEENVRKALRMAVDAVDAQDVIRDMALQSGMNITDWTDEDAVSWCVEQMYSERLKQEIEKRLQTVKVCEVICALKNTGEYAVQNEEDERSNGRDTVFMPDLFGERLAYCGTFGFGSEEYRNGPFGATSLYMTYISESGEVIVVKQYENWLSSEPDYADADPRVIYRERVSFTEMQPTLNCLMEIPDGFREFIFQF